MVVVFWLCWVFWLVFWFLLGLAWFPCFAFAALHAFALSLTGAQRTDSSPASKKKSSYQAVPDLDLGAGGSRLMLLLFGQLQNSLI